MLNIGVSQVGEDLRDNVDTFNNDNEVFGACLDTKQLSKQKDQDSPLGLN